MSGAYVSSTQAVSQMNARRNEMDIGAGKRRSLPNVVAWPPTMRCRARWVTWLALILVAARLGAQTGSELDVLTRIRDEANARSQILRSVHFLADVYGPRLTGSPNLRAAGEWAVAAMESWGLTNGHLSPWNWGRDGWANERFSAHIISPVKDALVGEVLAWTPGTNGVVTAQAFHLRYPDRPTS